MVDVARGGRKGRRRWATRVTALVVVAWLPSSSAVAATATTTTSPPPTPATSVPPSQTPAAYLAAIRSDQTAVITQRHQTAISFADLAVTISQTTVTDDQQALTKDQVQAASAAAAAASAATQLAADSASLLLAASLQRATQARLAGDRLRLRGIAVGMYTGALTGPEPSTLQSLETDQQAVFDQGQVEVVAKVVVTDLHTDVTAAAAADRRQRQLVRLVSADQQSLTTDRGVAAAAAARARTASALLTADQRQLATNQRQLDKARADLRAALAALAGPRSVRPTGLSVLGASALNANQLATWFSAEGYRDLTAASVTQLAGWYLQAGAAEGVRGDVAFAQAVLETGGFSSSDAVGLNNYAGIGHCDSCPAGWAFPSPHAGVVGQLQLLQIFADTRGAPRHAPAPVLPALTPSRQSRRGCCQTWESLTGVWATDPSYGARILSIYQQMLALAASQPALVSR